MLFPVQAVSLNQPTIIQRGKTIGAATVREIHPLRLLLALTRGGER